LKKATALGERLFVDFSGPYSTTVGGNNYWLLDNDDYSCKSWCLFAKRKSDIAELVKPLLTELKGANKPVKFLQCDNAGENTKQLQDLYKVFGIESEFTAPHTPQQNGVVDRMFVTLQNRGMAMMIDAKLKESTQSILWGEAVSYACYLSNILTPMRRDHSPNYYFFGEHHKVPELIEWGRVGYVTIQDQYVKKFSSKAIKMIHVGAAVNHGSSSHCMYNLEKNTVIITQDIKWAEWHGPMTATDNMPLLEQARGIEMETVGSGPTFPVVDPSQTVINFDDPIFTNADDDDGHADCDSNNTLPVEDNNNHPTVVNVPVATPARVNRELARLATSVDLTIIFVCMVVVGVLNLLTKLWNQQTNQ
jgi:hypothetical protein